MFKVNDDLSIYVTRGDIVFFSVAAEENGEKYTFHAGDLVRLKVFAKKDCENVVLQKDFPVTEDTELVDIFLEEEDTKIGDVISKPTDYWYEVELNPFDNPQTIIGYDEDGAKVFKLFPEGDDLKEVEVAAWNVPFVDDALDMTSTRPVQNQAIASAVVTLNAAIKANKKRINTLSGEITVERARITNLAKLKDGSTTGDAEVIDIRVGADGTIYDSAGEAVRGQIAKVTGNVDDLAPHFELTGDSDDYNYRLMSVARNSGETLRFLVSGARCNIIGLTASEQKKIFVNQAKESNVPYEVVLTDDIVSVGIYLLETGTAKVYLIGNFMESTYDVLGEKVSGGTIYTNEKTEFNSGLLFRIVDGKVTRNNYASGNCAKCNVESSAKVIISGFGWDFTYDYFLYAFADRNNNVVLLGTDDNTAANNVELDVPEGAVNLFVNGRIDNTDADIKVMATSTNFEDLYRYYSGKSKGKPKLIALGDSITALGTGNRGWLKYFIEKTECELVANVAVDGAVLADYSGTVYNGSPTTSTQTHNVLGNQVQKIANNAYDEPDIIMISIGTNGGIEITKDDIRAAYYDEDNALIPLESVNRRTDAGAYRYCTETLHNLYPNAVIFWCAPIMGFQSTRSADNAVAYAESLRIATEYSGQIMIDSIRCGINGVNEHKNASGEYLVDGLHPNANGAKRLGYYNASVVKAFL